MSKGVAIPSPAEAIASWLVLEQVHTLKDVFRTGASPGFLAAVIEANLGEIAGEYLDWARGCGELHCEACDGYYNYFEAPLQGQHRVCPRCGHLLAPSCCALCATSLASKEVVAISTYRGLYFCQECLPTAQQVLSMEAILRQSSGR